MFKALGFVIILIALSHITHEAFSAFEDALTETFHTVELAATLSQHRIADLDN